MESKTASAIPDNATARGNKISEVFREESGRLLAFVRQRVSRLEDAEDIVQDVFYELSEMERVLFGGRKFCHHAVVECADAKHIRIAGAWFGAILWFIGAVALADRRFPAWRRLGRRSAPPLLEAKNGRSLGEHDAGRTRTLERSLGWAM